MLIEHCNDPGLTLSYQVTRRRDRAQFDFADSAFKPAGAPLKQPSADLGEGPPGLYSAVLAQALTNWWEAGDYTVRVVDRKAGVVRALLLASMPDAR